MLYSFGHPNWLATSYNIIGLLFSSVDMKCFCAPPLPQPLTQLWVLGTVSESVERRPRMWEISSLVAGRVKAMT